MITTLVRENPAVRGLRKFLLVAIGMTLLQLNVATAFVWADGTMALWLFAALFWVAPAMYLVFGQHHTRCSQFDLGLPVPARQLWLGHMIAVIVAGLAVLVVTGLALAGGMAALVALTHRNPLAGGRFGNLVLYTAAALVLALVVTQLTRSAQSHVPATLGRRLLLTLAALAGYALTLVLLSLTPVVAVAALAAAGGLVAWNYRLVPRVFDVAVSGGTGGVMSGEVADWSGYRPLGSGWRFDLFLWRTLSRTAHSRLNKKMSPWIASPFTILFGAVLGGGIDDEHTLAFLAIPMMAYILVAFTSKPLANTQLVDALPIRRRTFLKAIVLPQVVALVVGYGGGAAGRAIANAHRAHGPEQIMLIHEKEADRYFIHVPPQYCRIAWSDDVPPADSPWGETSKVWCHPIFPGSPLRLYLPVGISRESSLDFVALQLSRATELVYGEAVPPDEIASRYLEVRDDGSVGLATRQLTIAADYPSLRAIGDGPTFPYVVGMSLVLAFLLTSVYMGSLRAGVSKRRQTWAFIAVLGVAMGLWILEFVLGVTNIMDPDHLAAVLMIWLRAIGSTPVGVIGVWAACLALVLLAYRLMEVRFERIEAPTEPVSVCL